MKNVFRLTIVSLTLAMIAIIAFPAHAFADTTPEAMHVSCSAPNPDHQTGLHRPKGDGNIWTFSIVLDGGARFVKGPFWSFPGKGGNDPDWGLITGGADGDSSLSWSSPGKTGEFQVRANGQIACGDDGGGGEPIDFSAGWDGEVEFNAEIKVKRKGSGDDYSSSATVAAGGLGSSEHKADVMVIATDDDGNPMEGITVDAPTIQNGDGVETSASISPSSATTDSEGKAYFSFTSSDKLITVTLEEDGGESSASATIEQQWASGDGDWEFDEYFDYDTPSDITFSMQLGGDGNIPLTGHSVSFINTELDGWEWNAYIEDYDYIYLSKDEIPVDYNNLVTYSVTTKSPLGTYTTQQTVYGDDYFIVDIVWFDAVDGNVYRDSN